MKWRVHIDRLMRNEPDIDERLRMHGIGPCVEFHNNVCVIRGTEMSDSSHLRMTVHHETPYQDPGVGIHNGSDLCQ